jgi:hypothetical protein
LNPGNTVGWRRSLTVNDYLTFDITLETTLHVR